MDRKDFYWISISATIVILLVALLVWQRRASQKILIGREQAIQNAIQACPRIGLQQIEQPTDANAELTSYTQALYRQQDPSVEDPPHSERQVWVVQ